MKHIHNFLFLSMIILSVASCNKSTKGTTSDGAGSEIATSVVSGSINQSVGSTAGYNESLERRTRFAKLLDSLNPIPEAHAAVWACTAPSLSPAYSGASTTAYKFTPISCSVTFKNGKAASSSWGSTYFNLLYTGTNCSASSALPKDQGASCSISRTTPSGGATRTITGPLGNSFSITHDTNGAGTGYSSSVSPAPTNSGVILTCDSTSGCTAGHSLVVNGSHITGSITLAGASSSSTLWDHTVSTGTSGLRVKGSGTSRVVSGTITVQHNIAKFTTTTTFNSVAFSDANCCFPEGGSVTTVFTGGPNDSLSETLTFSTTCGEATLTSPDGSTSSLTLEHCI